MTAAVAALFSLLAGPGTAFGQGCMPLRFTSPNLGGQHLSYLQAHEWELGVSVRRVATHRFYVGSQEDETQAPGGQPLYLRLNSLDLGLTYAISERLSFALTVPFSYSTASNFNPDGLRHQISSGGIGDINLMGNLWVGLPHLHPNGNVALGLGIKSNTGSNHVTDAFYTPAGGSQQPVPQTVQLGDGGWAILLQAQGFRRVFSQASVYLTGSYSVSLKQHTDVLWPPANALWAVPDVYSARVGMSYQLNAEPGLVVSLGGRVDGTTVRDLVGGRTDYYRHAGYTEYLDPGVSLQLGPTQFNLNVPVRVHHRYMDMVINNGQSVRLGSGGVNDFVIYASFTRHL